MRKFVRIGLVAILLIYAAPGLLAQEQKSGEVVYFQRFLPQNSENTATLYFNQSESIYFYGRSDDGGRNTKVYQDDENLTYKIEYLDKEGWSYYKNLPGQYMLSRVGILDEFFIIREQMPLMKWQIHTEKKKIGGFECRKATTSFRGRNFTAWYAPELAAPTGPWKFHGLPGLILRVSDDDNLFLFQFVSFRYIDSREVSIKPPGKGQVITWNKYVMLMKKSIRNLEKTILANLPDPSSVEVGINEDQYIEKLVIE